MEHIRVIVWRDKQEAKGVTVTNFVCDMPTGPVLHTNQIHV